MGKIALAARESLDQTAISGFGEILVLFAAGILVITLLRWFVKGKITDMAQNTESRLDDFAVYCLRHYFIPLLYFIVFYYTLKSFNINETINKIIDKAAFFGITIIVTLFLSRLITFLLNYYIKKEENATHSKAVIALKNIIKVILWSIALMLFLDNIGFKITGLITGLGIGGIAVAIAAQALLKDILSYFSIFLDKPFEPGDFIIIDDYMGTVEHIGVQTTKIRSLSGEMLIFSNTDITNSRVRNYKRMEERRVLFKINVSYHTPTRLLKTIPQIIRNSVEKNELTRFDRSHFKEIGDSGLQFETVYYVLTNDYNMHMDILQNINLSIKETFDKKKIQFSYPTQSVYLHKSR